MQASRCCGDKVMMGKGMQRYGTTFRLAPSRLRPFSRRLSHVAQI